MNKILVIADDNNGDSIGSVIEAEDRLEAVKMFIEKLQELEKPPFVVKITIDTDVKYI